MNADKPYYVYVLWSESRRCFYTGVTDDVEKRTVDHNSGVSKWTKGKGPWRVVFRKSFRSLGDARKFENHLKRQKGGNTFYELTGLDRAALRSHGS